MIARALLATLASAFMPISALAQPLFANPFSDAATYRNDRGEVGVARHRLRYEMTYSERGGAPVVSEFVVDVGPDWSVTRQGAQAVLRDFRLNRIFVLGDDQFTTMNGLADLTFRIMERQNRSYLQRVLDAAGAHGEQPDACDAEAELGIVLPGDADAGQTDMRERNGAIVLRCAGREIGSFIRGEGDAVPAAFWPTMYAAMLTHPALYRSVRETGHAPASLEISFREGTGGLSRRTWRLLAVESVDVPYPLDASRRNTTSDALDQLVPGAGQAGAEAVAGRAQNGAPTLQTWGEHLQSLSETQSPAAAAMLLSPTFNMFPELQCGASQQHIACGLARNLRATTDPRRWR